MQKIVPFDCEENDSGKTIYRIQSIIYHIIIIINNYKYYSNHTIVQGIRE